MGFFKNLFTWWDGATLGTALFSWKNGRKVGEDGLGNRYFETKKAGGRRWVMYSGSNDVSRVPPEWYAWLTRQIDMLPDELPPAPKFLRDATPRIGVKPRIAISRASRPDSPRSRPAAFRLSRALRSGDRPRPCRSDWGWPP